MQYHQTVVQTLHFGGVENVVEIKKSISHPKHNNFLQVVIPLFWILENHKYAHCCWHSVSSKLLLERRHHIFVKITVTNKY